MQPELVDVDLTDDSPTSVRRWAGLCSLVEAEAVRTWGEDLGLLDAESQRRAARSNPDVRHLVAVVEADGEVVGGARLRLDRTTPSTARGWVDVDVDHRRQGLGRRLAEWVVERARAEGVHDLRAGVDHGRTDDAAGEPFCEALGLTRVQRAVVSELVLPLTATAEAGAGYAIRTVAGMPPAQWLDGLARLKTRMGTDAPSGDAEPVVSVWDPARVASRYERSAANGYDMLTAVAVHEASGEVVGFTELIRHPGQADLLHQGDTLVIREHRGHGLGAALKGALLADATARLPEVTRTRTSNAAENAPMLAVNEALGYRAIGGYTFWRCDL